MTTTSRLVVLAVFVSSTMGVWAQMLPNTPPYPRTGVPGTPEGEMPERTSPVNTPADPKTAREVRAALAQLINTAFTADKFSDLAGQLAVRHRNRLGDLSREDYGGLNQAIQQFRQEFQNRYHQSFAFSADMLKTADISMPSRKVAIVALREPPSRVVKGPSGLSSGRVADIAEKDQPFVVAGPLVILTNEGSERDPVWRLDIPTALSGRQLKDNLAWHIQQLNTRHETWPDDAAMAYHMAAREVLVALWDKKLAVAEPGSQSIP